MGRPEPSAHPLAIALALRISDSRSDPNVPFVLLVGVGSGRNVPPFRERGFAVDALDDDGERADAARLRFAPDDGVRIACGTYNEPPGFSAVYDGALSTHALLHGTPEQIGAALRAIAASLAPGAPLYATLGSRNDPRYGVGAPLGAFTFVPETGPERGVAHSYFDENAARELLTAFAIESIDEIAGGEHVGRWAHDAADAAGIVHWFVRARRRS